MLISEPAGQCCGTVHSTLLRPHTHQVTPPEYMALITADPKAWTKRAWAMNRAFAMSSTIATIVPLTPGLQTLKISGSIYTSLNALRPSTGDLFDDTAGGKNKFGAYAQVYWSGANEKEEADYRITLSHLPGNSKSMVLALQSVLKQNNAFLKAFAAARTLAKSTDELTLIINPEDTQYPAGVHKRAFSDPTTCEIAALLPSLYDGDLSRTSVAITKTGERQFITTANKCHGKYTMPSADKAQGKARSGTLRQAQLTMYAFVDPLAYPLLFPTGVTGHHAGMITEMPATKTKKKSSIKLTLMQYTRAMLIEHVDETPPEDAFKLDNVPVRPNLLTITGGYLLQMWIIDKWLACEDSRLQYDKQRSKQYGTGQFNKLAAVARDPTQSVADHVKPTYLSSSMYGSAQWYRARFHDLIQAAIDCGAPTLFITMTT